MINEPFRIVFSRGTTLTDAWRACGVELRNPRNPPWSAYRPDGTLVLTVWRDRPESRWTRWHTGNCACDLGVRRPGEILGESARRIAKLDAHNETVRRAAEEEATIIVLVLNWRRDRQGEFVPSQRGASRPVEAWRAKITKIDDGRQYAYSIAAIDRDSPPAVEKRREHVRQPSDESRLSTPFCRVCAREAFRAWRGWCSFGTTGWRGRERDKLCLPDLPRLQEGRCPYCGSTEALAAEHVQYRNYHGRFNTGLPDFFELVIAEPPNSGAWRWGRPYMEEGIGRIPWPEMLERIASFDEERRAIEVRARFMEGHFAGGGRGWDWSFGSKESTKVAPDPVMVTRSIENLKANWAEIVGAELAAMTRPLKFTGPKSRRLVVAADASAKPPWGSWSVLSTYLPERRTFTALRAAINAEIAPLRVDHVEFQVGILAGEGPGASTQR